MTRNRAEPLLARMATPAADLTKRLIAAADATGVSLLLVGGPVRDFLLERPLVDVDLLVEHPDAACAVSLAEAAADGQGKLTRHERFGTVTLATPEASVDLATVRSESYGHDGALPTVAAGTLEQDLLRRDFSVNAMALPLSKAARNAHPEIVDFADGLADLEAGRLRVLHARSFHDDPTRALRAARLGPRLGFSLARSSRTALRDGLRDGAFGRVSGDRYRRELVKLFADAERGLDPPRALRLLDGWHVLGALEPGLGLSREAVVPLRRLGRLIVEPPWQLGRWRPWLTGLGLWLAPLRPQLRHRALRRFGVRGGPAQRAADMPRTCDRCLRALARARGRGAIDTVLGRLAEEELVALYTGAEPALRRRIARYATEDRHRRLPISGADLTAAGLGGPAVGRALERIREAHLDGRVRTREEALALAKEIARRRTRTRR